MTDVGWLLLGALLGVIVGMAWLWLLFETVWRLRMPTMRKGKCAYTYCPGRRERGRPFMHEKCRRLAENDYNTRGITGWTQRDDR